ncbi:MAG: glutamine-hydrolyzing carbamoyl-phosphate synthase small subunit [Planctomycetota bacterium]
MQTGRLALADGTLVRGRAFGATGRGGVVTAEVVFNTAMSGYQESLTDPSYRGQILIETCPLIGNTGINEVDVESDAVQVSGFVVRELTRRHSNFRATGDLSSYLAVHNVLGLAEVDTRALTRRIRSAGAMPGALTDDARVSDAALIEQAKGAAGMAGQDLVSEVGIDSEVQWGDDLGPWATRDAERSPDVLRVLAFDCGAKRNILRHLTQRGCAVTVVPHTTPAEDVVRRIESGEIDGVFVSNGPGDPAAVEVVVETLQRVLALADTPPVFGICLGHQLLARAAGATTFKLPFGHRGTNQPVHAVDDDRVEITSQNHGFAVDPQSLEACGGRLTHVHLNDGTAAGFELSGRPVFAVQYHPEASPGPHDARVLFDKFVRLMRDAKAVAR